MQNEHDIIGDFVSLVGAAIGLAVFTPDKQRMVDTMLRAQWGGQEVYVKKHSVDIGVRALEVKAKYNGRNRKELMLEYNISRSQFYRFVKDD